MHEARRALQTLLPGRFGAELTFRVRYINITAARPAKNHLHGYKRGSRTLDPTDRIRLLCLLSYLGGKEPWLMRYTRSAQPTRASADLEPQPLT